MANKLLIVHGYSDGSTSFTGLGEFLVAQGRYRKENVFYLDYSSMDDEATFRDFADKLDSDHRARLGQERVDVACHSTGSLVVRAWLALHAHRTKHREETAPCPVDRLLCFAPANFGSDLARLGQSFLGKFRTTFFNSHQQKGNFLESGKAVLQGLEPASPFQWELSALYDLHHETSYFNPRNEPHRLCYPFVLAAGEAYSGIEAKLLKERALPGTDGTVRIPGTSLNTRGCSLDFRETGAQLLWWKRFKYDDIPFAVFAGFNHGTIINPQQNGFAEPHGPGGMAVKALQEVTDLASYQSMAETFTKVCEQNYKLMPGNRQDAYQQFFFRVRDDIDQVVEDYFIDFYVATRDGRAHAELTLFFDEEFEGRVTRHSASPSHRVFMMNCAKLHEFHQRLIAEDACLMLEITGASSLPDVRYEMSQFVAFDPKAALKDDEPMLLKPNTTTLVDVILNRRQADRLLVIKDCTLTVVVETVVKAAPVVEPPKGRAELIGEKKKTE